MKFITKKTTDPPPLKEFKQACHGINCTYENFGGDHKERYKKYLLNEQGYICAYCMNRIYLENMRIEHLYPQCLCSDEQGLSHSNMVAVCNGLIGTTLHCDRIRGTLSNNDQLLNVNPTDPVNNVERILKFIYGKISSVSDSFDINDDLDRRLNLNYIILIQNRIGVLEGLHISLNKIGWELNTLRKQLDKWEKKDGSGKYDSYCQIAINYLKKKIRQKHND